MITGYYAWYRHPDALSTLPAFPDAQGLWSADESVTPLDVLEALFWHLTQRGYAIQVGDCVRWRDTTYVCQSTQWVPVIIHDDPPAHRPLAYGMSPLAPRGAYSQAAHETIAEALADWIWHQGFLPVLPHLYLSRFLDDARPEQRTAGIAVGQAWLSQCPTVFQLAVPPSPGMQAEHTWALQHYRDVMSVPWHALDRERFGLPAAYDDTTIFL